MCTIYGLVANVYGIGLRLMIYCLGAKFKALTLETLELKL